MRLRPENDAVRLTTFLEDLVAESRAIFLEAYESDVVEFEGQTQSKFLIGGLQNRQCRVGDFRADPIPGQY